MPWQACAVGQIGGLPEQSYEQAGKSARSQHRFKMDAFSDPSYPLALAAIEALGSLRAAENAVPRRENLA